MQKRLNIIELSSYLDGAGPENRKRESLDFVKSLYTTEIIDPKDIDNNIFTVLFIASGGSEEKFLQIADLLPKPVVLLSDSYNNSLPAALEISSWLHNNNVIFRHINIPAELSGSFKKDLEKEIRIIEKIQCGFSAISKYRISLIGGESPWLISSHANITYLQKQYGATFIEKKTSEIAKEFSGESTDDKESQDLIQKLSLHSNPSLCRSSIPNAVKLYKILKRYIQNNKINALTIKCFDFIKSCDTTACLALALLNEEGIVCGCEGDIPSLWSMIIVKEICGTVSFMANPSSVERLDKSIDFAHCTAPLNMGSVNRFTTHYESGIGVGIASEMKIGKFTLFKCGGELLDMFYCYTGEVVQNTSVKERCRTQVKFVFRHKEDLDNYMNTFLGNHTILVPGKHKKTLDYFISLQS